MLAYLVRRILIGLLTLVLITFVVYALIRNMPGTPLTYQLGETDPSRKIRPEDLERMKRAYGLDKPWYVAYFQWMGNLLRGDLGRSLSRKQAVSVLIGERIGPTLLLSATSLILAYLLSVPLGLYASVRNGTYDERIISTLLYMLYSLPSFVAALFLLSVFAMQLAGTPFELPLFGMYSDHFRELPFFGKVLDIMRHMFLPVLCYTYGSLAYFCRFVKSNMLEVIRQDYIRTARAKGVPPTRVVVVHAFRNTLIPFVTLVGLTLPGLLSGSVILEQIFAWPGMGRLFFEAITERDYPTIMGLVLMFSVLTLLGQLLADILYAVVDPRVTYS
ncbi:MAG: ABC transporter permease [Thermoguttaceae bacterium]|nr:ABC transporter permease [Thermoguttaceae bacterium]MDW8078710.1 ABC transporter permease [Thermoguttaceae bacterium]